MNCPDDSNHLLGEMPFDCDSCAAFADGLAVGARSERSKIAAWLRTRRGDDGPSLAEELIASSIERGDHDDL